MSDEVVFEVNRLDFSYGGRGGRGANPGAGCRGERRGDPGATSCRGGCAAPGGLALRGVRLRLPGGAFYSIIGPNGSGKTTLLNVLSGSLPPAAGAVVFDGRPLSSYSVREIAQKVAFVRQATDIRFPFTCLELVLMGRSPFGGWTGRASPDDLEIASRAMEDTDTAGFATRAVTSLSAGERQRVLFARALAQTPRVLFLDEAFSNMDIFYVVKLLGLIRRMVRRDGLTVLSVTHDLNMAHAFSDYVIAMDRGRVVRVGRPAEVVNSEFIRALLGVEVAATAVGAAEAAGGCSAVAAADGPAADAADCAVAPIGIAVLPRLPATRRRECNCAQHD